MWRKLSRGELLSTFFPSWIWQGRMWAKGRIPKYDPYYWLVSDAHPVVSTYYPFSVVVSFFVGLFRPQGASDNGFRAYVGLLGVHVIFMAFGWYSLVHIFYNSYVAIFGAGTFALSAYNWKQQPCFIYTIAWAPWVLTGIATHNILLTSIAFGMVILAGYYPIGIQIALVAGCATVLWNCPPYWIPIGVLLGSRQLISFLKYLPKTIRANKVSEIGKVPWWHPITLIFPLRRGFNGVGFWEMSYYVGILPLFFVWFSTSAARLGILAAYLLMVGLGSRFLPRIPARWCWLFQTSLGWCAVSGLANLHLTEKVLAGLILVQAFDLIWHNADLLPTSPYSELYNKPSRAFNTQITRYLEGCKGRISGLPYPLFTGHINQLKTLGYCGGMQLKLMSKFRGDKNPDGDGQHDWFKKNEDGEALDRYRVHYAYTTKRIFWSATPIKHLYRNPRINAD